jgi:hypothetical protein
MLRKRKEPKRKSIAMTLMRDVQGSAAEKRAMFEKVRAAGGLPAVTAQSRRLYGGCRKSTSKAVSRSSLASAAYRVALTPTGLRTRTVGMKVLGRDDAFNDDRMSGAPATVARLRCPLKAVCRGARWRKRAGDRQRVSAGARASPSWSGERRRPTRVELYRENTWGVGLGRCVRKTCPPAC